MILLDSSYSHFQSHSCLCLKKRNCAFPACACKSSKYRDFPFFRCSPFSLCIFQEWDGRPVPSVPFLWETGIKKYKTDTPGVPVLCLLNGTVQQDMHAPGTQTRCRQDATPDFPACLCQMEPYRRHGNSGTGRMRPAVSGGIVPQAHGEPKGRPGLCPGGCTYFLWL